jgi:peptide/nickel transport system substrate-binding protein
MNQMIIAFNLNHTDPVMRKIFQDKNFRIGMSYAINRKEIIDLVYVSQGEPWQAAPRKETPWYNETLAKQYTEYDVAKANEALDKVLPQKDGEGFRLRPDGKRLSFQVEVQSVSKEWQDAMNLISGYWKKVGIDGQVKVEDRSLLYTRKDANQHDAVVWGGDGGLKDGLIEARWYFPFSNESNYAEAWMTYFRNPSGAGAQTKPEEPPADVKKQMDLYNQIIGTGDEAKQIDLMKQIMAIAVDQFYAIGTVLPPNGYGIVKNNVGNVPKSMFSSGGPYLNPAPTNTSTYFFK